MYKCEIEEELNKIKKEGMFTHYFEDNSFVVGEMIKSKKEGLWICYEPFGEEIKSILFKNNKKISEY